MNIGFFVGHEKLLWQAKALVESITRLDCFTDSEIILVTRKKLANSFNDYNVKIMYIDNDYSRLPFCDKVYAASCFEQKITGQYLWLDVDSYFIKSVEFKNDNHIMLNSVDMRNIGNLYSEDLDEFWSILYQYFKLDNKQNKEITAITKEEIYPYFNIGMVLVNQNRSVFKQTYKALNEILNLDEISLLLNSSSLHRIFIHQAVFSCVVLSLYNGEYTSLPSGINYPLHLLEKDNSELDLSQIKSIRYDTYFNNKKPPKIWKEVFKPYQNKLNNYWYYN